MTNRTSLAVLAASLCTLLAASNSSAQSRLDGLGLLPGAEWTGASLLSADGSIVVGSGGLSSGEPSAQRIFRWTPPTATGGGIMDAANQMVLPRPALPFAMSADGIFIVGDYTVNGVTRGYRLNVTTQTIDIISVPGSTRTTATVVSDDGSIVGLYCAGCTDSRAYLWSSGGPGGQFTPLPMPAGVTTGWLEPRTMNTDGSVIAGTLRQGGVNPLFRWSAVTGTAILAMPGEAVTVQPFGISADGRTIVGDYLTSSFQRLAFRWREGVGGESLVPVPSGSSSRALDISDDGTTIVGSSGEIGSARAYFWTEARGLVRIADELAAAGVDVTNWTLSSAAAVSPDGSVMAGDGFHDGATEAWRAVLGQACIADYDDGSGTGTRDGGVTIDDLLYYIGLFEAGDVRADIDDGTATGTPDGGVTIEDLLYYLARFDAGC